MRKNIVGCFGSGRGGGGNSYGSGNGDGDGFDYGRNYGDGDGDGLGLSKDSGYYVLKDGRDVQAAVEHAGLRG